MAIYIAGKKIPKSEKVRGLLNRFLLIKKQWKTSLILAIVAFVFVLNLYVMFASITDINAGAVQCEDVGNINQEAFHAETGGEITVVSSVVSQSIIQENTNICTIVGGNIQESLIGLVIQLLVAIFSFSIGVSVVNYNTSIKVTSTNINKVVNQKITKIKTEANIAKAETGGRIEFHDSFISQKVSRKRKKR